MSVLPLTSGRFVSTREIRTAVEGLETRILDALNIDWRSVRRYIACPYPGHPDHNPSWRWDQDKRKAFCSCGSRDVLGVLMGVEEIEFDAAKLRAAELLKRTDLIRARSTGCRLAAYADAKKLPIEFLRSLGVMEIIGKYGKPEIGIPYRNGDGQETAVRVRYRLTGKRRFRWQTGSKACLYGLDRLADAREAGFVILVEGESDCHTLWHHGIPALGLPGNTQWNEARDAPLLEDISTIYALGEPDQGGETMRKRFAGSLILPRVRLVRLGVKDPSALHLELEGDPERFRTAFQVALDAAELYPAIAGSGTNADGGTLAAKDGAEIARLGKLLLLNYARERKHAAKNLNVPLSMLDRLVAEARGRETSSVGQGRPVELHEVEPWAEPVDGAALLDEITRRVREYVIVSDVQADAIALWNVHTHAFEAAETSPKLVVKSPQKRSGKSRLVEVLERTTARALFVSGGIKPAALLRLIESHAPTLLLNEVDALMKQGREMAEALRGIMNSGFNRAGARCIMNVPTVGGGWEPAQFSTWAPQLLSGIGDLPDTVRDRSIEIVMKRKLTHEKVKRLRQRDGDDLRTLARKSARWARDNLSALRDAQPEAPPGLNDRATDAWEPLFAIADCAGGDWPHCARAVALALSGNPLQTIRSRPCCSATSANCSTKSQAACCLVGRSPPSLPSKRIARGRSTS
jgi:hypothetical protein